ncbi:hypothetical protein E1H13_25270 [Nodosilinea sp. P-1105]|nr:hypothetical protein [Nodosilinea sp. P-1105]
MGSTTNEPDAPSRARRPAASPIVTSSVFLKTPQRIAALAMVMGLTVMVYRTIPPSSTSLLLHNCQCSPNWWSHRSSVLSSRSGHCA